METWRNKMNLDRNGFAALLERQSLLFMLIIMGCTSGEV